MHIAYFLEWLTAECCCGSTWMNANELIVRAQDPCRQRRIRFPSDLRQYASQWQREDFDLQFCWHRVKPLLATAGLSGRPRSTFVTTMLACATKWQPGIGRRASRWRRLLRQARSAGG